MTLNGDWEVGLFEISFPKMWYNVFEGDCWINIKLEDEILVKVEIPKGLYKTELDFLRTLTRECNTQLKATEYGDDNFKNILSSMEDMRFENNYIDRTVIVTLPRIFNMTFSQKLIHFLGLENMNTKLTDKNLIIKGTKMMDLDANVGELYVYCDILEHVHVGDIKAPLLRIVSGSGQWGERIRIIFERPLYVPVQKKTFRFRGNLYKDGLRRINSISKRKDFSYVTF